MNDESGTVDTGLTERRLSFFVVTRTIPFFFDQTLNYLVPLIIYVLTGNPALSGVAFLVQWLPSVISMPVSGAVNDRFSPFPQLFWTDVIRAVLMSVVAFGGAIPFVLVGAGLTVLCGGHATISTETTLVRGSSTNIYPRIQARFQATQQLAMVGAPALAGLLVLLPLELTFTVLSFGYALSAIVTRFGFAPVRTATEGQKLKSLAGAMRGLPLGFKIVLRRASILWLIVLTSAVNLSAGMLLATLSPIVIGELNSGSSVVALVATGGTIASLTVAIGVSIFVNQQNIDRCILLYLCLFVFGATILVVSTEPLVFGFGFGAWNAGVAVFSIWMRSWRARVLPAQSFGTALGAFMFLILLSVPISGGVLAVSAGFFEAGQVLMATLVVSLLVVAVGTLAFKRALRLSS